MHGPSVAYGTTWADIGNAVGYFEDDDPATFQSYIERVLNGERVNNVSEGIPVDRVQETCPATLAEVPFKEPTNAKERKQDAAFDKVLAALITNPLTVQELAHELGISIKLIRVAVERLRARRLLLQSPHGLLFLTVGKKEHSAK
jgi:hypothetical protein